MTESWRSDEARESAQGGPVTSRRVRASAVRLRLLRSADADDLARLESTNRRHLLTGAPAHGEDWRTPAGQRADIAQVLAQNEAGTCLPMAILLEDGPAAPPRIVGRITLNQILRGPAQWASVGYWVDEAETGRGIATHALRQMIDVAFEGLGLHRLEAGVVVGNDASAGVLRACGFQEYGLAPRMLRLGVAGDGWADCRLFQLVDLRGEADDPHRLADSSAGTAQEDVPRTRVEVPPLGEALALYESAGRACTLDPESLGRALVGSTRVVTARAGERLLGLARVLSDGAGVAYLQDVLVDPSARRQGLGRRLAGEALAPFAHVQRQVLVTGDDPGPRAFAEALGMTESHACEPGLRAFVRQRAGSSAPAT